MNNGPDLPVFVLEHGDWRVEVFDPRPDPLALGARYVHGGYVSALRKGDRCLSGRAAPQWDPYVGQGLPEVFEFPLASGVTREGEEYLRIGAGRLIRHGLDLGSRGVPTTPVAWEVMADGRRGIQMRCRDRMCREQQVYGYELTRQIRLMDDGLESTTRLCLDVPWSHPIGWLAHPFFAQTGGNATGFSLPSKAQVLDANLIAGADGLWRLPADGGLANVVGLWGSMEPVVCHLDKNTGGGRMEISLDRPLDHLVIYASTTAASPEPQLVRGWKNREATAWTLRYRWLEGEG